MTKKEERLEARRLRREGISIKAIAEALGCGKGTVSDWCRDIVLTQEQEEALQKSDKRRKAQNAAAEKNVRVHREKRLEYQEEGRLKARENDPLHVAGCMLYWGEGTKSRNSLAFVNSDIGMMRLFIRFLRESLNVTDDQFTISINVYLGDELSPDEIKEHWLSVLGLDRSALRKCRFNSQPISSQQKGRKLLYGTCSLYVTSTRLVQHIYGAIQEYAGIDKPEWLD
jgi:predicted transcriptional regulator